MKTHKNLRSFPSQILFNFKDLKTTQTGLNEKRNKVGRKVRTYCWKATEASHAPRAVGGGGEPGFSRAWNRKP